MLFTYSNKNWILFHTAMENSKMGKKNFLLSRSKTIHVGASLVVQWLGICLPMQGTWVWSLVQEDPTCHGATNLLYHNCWACALQQQKPLQWEACALPQSIACLPQLEKACTQQWSPLQSKINKYINIKNRKGIIKVEINTQGKEKTDTLY